MMEYHFSMQKVPGSTHGISVKQDQIAAAVKELYRGSWKVSVIQNSILQNRSV